MSGSDIEALKSLAASHNSWAEWATFAVFLDLLGEIVIVFMFTKDKPRREIILSAICAVVISFGVLGEWVFGSKATRENSQLQTISERKVADLNMEAANTRQKTAEAEERAAKLEQQLEWRSLTIAQKDAICKWISPFSGTTIAVEGITGDAEGSQFASDLSQVLQSKRCGWVVAEGRPGSYLWGGVLPEGVFIDVRESRNLPPAADALLHILKSVNVIAQRGDSPFVVRPSVAMTLFVGIKPRPKDKATKK